MADTPDVAILAQAIEAHDESVVSTLSALTDRCLVDTQNRTLFDVAILASHAEVIALLASDAKALEFAAPIDPKTKDPIRHAAAMHDVEYPISKLENVLQQSFGEGLAYGRTPLLTACHAGNTDAIESLTAAGAKTNVKDAIGLTAPELAFYAHGETGLRNFLAAYDSSNLSALPVGKRLLRETFAFPDTMEELLRIAKLDAYARRLLFCYRCAWLDIDAVKSMLADGHDPNKGLTAEINPLWEACTSELLWDEAIPGGFEMAYHLTKHWGHPGASSVSFDSALLNEDGSNFGKLFSEASRKQKEQVKTVEKMTIDPDTERDVIARRIAMLDVLLAAGADVGLARKKLEFGTFSDLKDMQLVDVADHLKRRGGTAGKPPKKRKPASSTFWELVGETGLNTEYWPEEGEGGLIRLVLHNVYGPVDGLTLAVRLSQDASEPGGEWRELKPVRESIDVDGEILSRGDLTEPVYGEAPWEAIYELPLVKGDAAKALWIRLDHDDEALRGELDAWVFAKGNGK